MSEPDPETKALMDAIYRDKVLRARRTPMDQKILDGPRLFDDMCRISRGGIRSQSPEFTNEQVEQELRRRLAIARRLADGNIYRNVESVDE